MKFNDGSEFVDRAAEVLAKGKRGLKKAINAAEELDKMRKAMDDDSDLKDAVKGNLNARGASVTGFLGEVTSLKQVAVDLKTRYPEFDVEEVEP